MHYSSSIRSGRSRKDLQEMDFLKIFSFAFFAWLVICSFSEGIHLRALCGLLGIGLVFPLQLKMAWFQFASYCKSRGWNANRILGFLLGVISATVVFALFIDPAHAQFFNQTEAWLRRSIPGMQNNQLIPLIFNVLRAIFVIYIGINLVNVIQKMQQQEDWQTLARTPLIIVVAVMMGDVLAGMVTGGAGGGTGGG